MAGTALRHALLAPSTGGWQGTSTAHRRREHHGPLPPPKTKHKTAQHHPVGGAGGAGGAGEAAADAIATARCANSAMPPGSGDLDLAGSSRAAARVYGFKEKPNLKKGELRGPARAGGRRPGQMRAKLERKNLRSDQVGFSQKTTIQL